VPPFKKPMTQAKSAIAQIASFLTLLTSIFYSSVSSSIVRVLGSSRRVGILKGKGANV